MSVSALEKAKIYNFITKYYLNGHRSSISINIMNILTLFIADLCVSYRTEIVLDDNNKISKIRDLDKYVTYHPKFKHFEINYY